MGLNDKCPIHGNLHPDYLCPDKKREAMGKTKYHLAIKVSPGNQEAGCRINEGSRFILRGPVDVSKIADLVVRVAQARSDEEVLRIGSEFRLKPPER